MRASFHIGVHFQNVRQKTLESRALFTNAAESPH